MKNYNNYYTHTSHSRICLCRQQRQFYRSRNFVGMYRHAGSIQQQHPELWRRHPERRHQPDVLNDAPA